MSREIGFQNYLVTKILPLVTIKKRPHIVFGFSSQFTRLVGQLSAYSIILFSKLFFYPWKHLLYSR
jgi:hypothetical protein